MRLKFVPSPTLRILEELTGTLRNDIGKKRSEIWPMASFFITTTSLPHLASDPRTFGWKKSSVCLHPLYPPDLAQCNLWLFPKIVLKGRSFDTILNNEMATIEMLKTLAKEAFQKCCQSWNERWDRCIANQEEVFEAN